MVEAILEAPSNLKAAGSRPAIQPIDAELLKRVLSLKGQLDISNTVLAKAIGVSESTISEVLKNKYRGASSEIAAKLQGWIANQRFQSPVKVLNRTYVETEGSKIIIGSLSLIRSMKTVGLIIGTPGTSKTTTNIAYQGKNPETIILTPPAGYGTNWWLLEELHAILSEGRKEKGLQKYRNRWQLVTDVLWESGRMLIIDNAHRLSASGFKLISDLNNDGEFAITLVGDLTLAEKMSYEPQDYWRGGFQQTIEPDWTDDQLKSIVSLYFDNPTRAFMNLCSAVAAGGGHLRGLSWALINARQKSKAGHSDVEALELAIAQLRPLKLAAD